MSSREAILQEAKTWLGWFGYHPKTKGRGASRGVAVQGRLQGILFFSVCVCVGGGTKVLRHS